MKRKEKELLQQIGTRIRVYRAMKHITQADLAFQAGLEQYQISNIENGKTSASITSLFAIAQALEISLAELITFDNIDKK